MGARRPVQEVLGGAEALVKLESGDWQVLFLDRRLPDLDAEELIQIIRRRFPGIEVVMLDSDSGQDFAGSAAEVHAAFAQVCPRLPENSGRAPVEPLPGMIGEAESMRRVYRLARLVAPRLTTVLILGPSGTGKELLARAIHQLSPRMARPFVVVNCAAIPETLLESELFGYTRGAFTGAVTASLGRIPAAQGGTLFLDEVGELPLGLQAKLLRFFEYKEIQRLGSTEAVRIDVRVVAATNADLARSVAENKFRSDLYYRLSAFPLELPPLTGRVSGHPPAGGVFSGAGGGGLGDAGAGAIPGGAAHSGVASLGRQRARAAAGDGAGLHSLRRREHHSAAASLFLHRRKTAAGERRGLDGGTVREILGRAFAYWQAPCTEQ